MFEYNLKLTKYFIFPIKLFYFLWYANWVINQPSNNSLLNSKFYHPPWNQIFKAAYKHRINIQQVVKNLSWTEEKEWEIERELTGLAGKYEIKDW